MFNILKEIRELRKDLKEYKETSASLKKRIEEFEKEMRSKPFIYIKEQYKKKEQEMFKQAVKKITTSKEKAVWNFKPGRCILDAHLPGFVSYTFKDLYLSHHQSYFATYKGFQFSTENAESLFKIYQSVRGAF